MRKVVFLLIVLSSIIGFSRSALAVRCDDLDTSNLGKYSESELRKYETACQEESNNARNKGDTLAGEIQYMDTQISVTQLEININLTEIKNLEKEIKSLSSRIGELNSTTDKISDVVKLKIEEMYKRQQTGFVYTLLGANNLPKFLRSIQYLRRSQISDRELLLKLQNTKVTYEEQKDLREEKEEELNQLTEKLESYKIELASQQQAKEQLLTITKNDEARYQQLLSDARRQISSFKAFTQSVGGGIISANSLGSGYDGKYFSQRDERWANSVIGRSSETILDVGCLVTSVAMVLKHKGMDITPANIAADSSFFFGDTAYMLYPTYSLPGGYTRTSINISDIDNELNNNPVIIGVYYGSYGQHFLVLKKKEGEDYIIYDPYYGPDKKFNDIYSKDIIFQADIIN
jgi:peptidoglycan hydrolase CwlO-like protein